MGGFGSAAKRAVELYTAGLVETPREAWNRAVVEEFGNITITHKKGCPRCAFLGLCEEGLVKGVPRGFYTTSEKNKEYAIQGVEILRENPSLSSDPMALWDAVLGERSISYNDQMHVVTALWNEGLTKR